MTHIFVHYVHFLIVFPPGLFQMVCALLTMFWKYFSLLSKISLSLSQKLSVSSTVEAAPVQSCFFSNSISRSLLLPLQSTTGSAKSFFFLCAWWQQAATRTLYCQSSRRGGLHRRRRCRRRCRRSCSRGSCAYRAGATFFLSWYATDRLSPKRFLLKRTWYTSEIYGKKAKQKNIYKQLKVFMC